MEQKEFFKLNKGKIILTIIIFIVISNLSLRIGITEESSYCPPDIMDACTVSGKLNPLLWLPAPLLTHDHSYSIYLGFGFLSSLPYFLRGELMIIVPITIPYWFALSYILSCLIFVKRNKYILGLSFSISGAIIGCIISYLFLFTLDFLRGILNISLGGRIPSSIASLVIILISAIFFSIPVIGAIWGWKYGYKIGAQKNDSYERITNP